MPTQRKRPHKPASKPAIRKESPAERGVKSAQKTFAQFLKKAEG